MRTKIALAIVLVAAVAACDDAAGPGTGLDAEELATLSDAMVAGDFAYSAGVATAGQPDGATIALDPVTATGEFSGARPCPAGGQVLFEGTRTRTWDPDTQEGSADLAMTKTHQECAREVRSTVITLNGDPDIAVEAHHAWNAEGPVGLQTLSMHGAFTWSTDDGREGSCTVDIEASFDPETMTRTVAGTFCEHTWEETTTWSGGGQGR